MWGKRYAPGDAMTGCDDVIIVEQRTTATTRSDPNVRLLISKIQLLLSLLFFLNNNNNNSFLKICYLPGESTETGLISADDASLSSVVSLKRRSAFCFPSFKNREKESWNETKKILAKSCKHSPSPLPI